MSLWKLDVENTFKHAERRFRLPNKLLTGAGPTNYSPRVADSLSNPSLGPISKELFQMMRDIKEMLLYVFQTKNPVTLALQTSGSGGIEAALTNVVDPGEKVLIPVGGMWGERLVQMGKARNVDVVEMVSAPGEVFHLKELEERIIEQKPVLVFITHGESSGGTIQPLEGLADICHKYNCLLAVDAVVSLGAVPLFTDRWNIDIVVSASQKAIGGPPGLSFLTFSQRAIDRMRSIKTLPPFYFDIKRLGDMWQCFNNPERYHVTYSASLLCAVREALAELIGEGLTNSWIRHKNNMERFWAGLENLGFKHYVPVPEERLWTVCLFYIPPKVKWQSLLRYIEEKYSMEIMCGIGHSFNKAVRVGFMGHNSNPNIVDYALEVLKEAIYYCQNNDLENDDSSRCYINYGSGSHNIRSST